MCKDLHDQEFPKHLKLQQIRPNIRSNNNGMLINVAKNSVVFAKRCAHNFNDFPIIVQSDFVLSSYKGKVKQYLLDKASAKYFMNQTFGLFEGSGSLY